MLAFFMVMCVLLVCVGVSGWPLLALARVRAAVLGAAGGSCVMFGAALFFAAITALPGISSDALAEEKKPEEAKAATSESAPQTDVAAPVSVAEQPEIEITKDTVVIPPGRPAWVLTEPDYSTDLHTVYVGSGPFVRKAEADRVLDKALVEAVNAYVVEQLGSPLTKTLLNYDARKIKDRFIKEGHIYHEVITVSVGPMHQAHALLEFSPKFRADLEKRWAKVRGTSRLMQTGLFSGSALLFLAAISGYFRFDRATRGSYSGRLQFMTAAAILAIIGAGVFFANRLTWL